MAETSGNAPQRSARNGWIVRWLGRLAVGLLLIAVVGLGVWFGLGKPRLWQLPQSARPVPTLAPNGESTATITTNVASTNTGPSLLPTVTPANASDERITPAT